MQNPSRLHPLAVNHATLSPLKTAADRETWSSDSDSGITVDCHSPPSRRPPESVPPAHFSHPFHPAKTTSGVGLDDPPSWTFPPPPPPAFCLLSYDGHPQTMTSSAAVTDARGVTRPALSPPPPPPPPETSSMSALGTPDKEERRRQQDYVRSTLLQYERQKMLEEQTRFSQGNILNDQDVILEAERGCVSGVSERVPCGRSSDPHAGNYGRCNGTGAKRHLLTTNNTEPYAMEHGPSDAGLRLSDIAHNYGTPRNLHFSHKPIFGANSEDFRSCDADFSAGDKPKDSFAGSENGRELCLGRTKDPNDLYSGNVRDKMGKFYHSDTKDIYGGKPRGDVYNTSGESAYRPPSTPSESRKRISERYPVYNQPADGARVESSCSRLDGLTGSQRRAVPNDYVPSRLVDKFRHSPDASAASRSEVKAHHGEVSEGSSRLESEPGYRDLRQYGDDLQQCRDELNKRLVAGVVGGGPRDSDSVQRPPSSPGEGRGREGGGGGGGGSPDDGYGTSDSRSTTTAASSLASPLSSSISSINTDSSSSLNGWQRPASSYGPGSGIASTSGSSVSARAQPVASGGRLVVARRPMLVKRKDLPPVEIRSDYGASLEERLRALTTIEEEDPSSSGSAAQHSSVSYPNGQSLTLPLRGEGRPDSSRDPARNADDRDLARAESGSGRVEEDLGYEEGLYCVMDKKQQPVRRTSAPLLRRTLPGSGSVRSMDSQPMREGERTFGGKPLAGPEDRPGNAPSLHRAVPIRGEPEGVSCYPSRTDDPGVSFGDQGHPAQRSAGGVSAARSQEVRFKAGGGGVKLNADSGRFEIDYSYYMKATPSESNDEVNTYSPDHTRADLEADVFDEPGEESAFHPQPGPPGWDRGPGGDGVIVIRDPRQRVGVEEGYYGGGGGGRTGSNAESGRVLRGGVGGEVGLRQGGVMSSMPNLSFPQPAGTRRSSATHDVYRHALPRRCSGEADLYGADGGSGRPASQQQQPHAGTHQADGPDSSARLPFPGPQPGYAPLSRDRRHPAPSSGYPVPGGRSAGQGDRNSCDAGSLYRRADRSQTFPPSQGLAADRLSLNLGDLPRIHEQLRATSEMLLSAGKRHQFASSSDIYKLFQGQQQQRQQQLAAGFSQGRQPPQRHSFHAFSSGQPPSQNLTDVRPCASRAGSGGQASRGSGDPPHGQTTPAGPHPPSPLRADRSIVGPENAGYSPYSGGGRDARSVYGRDVGSLSHADAGLSPRDVSLSPRDVAAYQAQLGHGQRGDPRSVPQVPGRDPAQGGRVTPSFRQRLSKGEQFATDLIQDPDGEKLSTLV